MNYIASGQHCLVHHATVELRHESDITAAGPHLSRRLAIHSPSEDILAGLQIGRNLDHILDGTVVCRALATLARWSECSLPVPVVVTSAAITSGRARARYTRSIDQPLLPRQAAVRCAVGIVCAGDAARAKGCCRHRDSGPHTASRERAIRHKDSGHWNHAAIREYYPLLFLIEIQLRLLETVLGERFIQWTQPITVATPMIVLDLPRHSRFAANLPFHSEVHWREGCAIHAVMSVLGGGVVASFGHFLCPRSASCEPAGVSGGSASRCVPRVVLVDVLIRSGRRVPVDGAVLGVNGALHAAAAKIDLATAAGVITFRATDEAALAVVERGLTIVAGVSSDVCTPGVSRPVFWSVDTHQIVD